MSRARHYKMVADYCSGKQMNTILEELVSIGSATIEPGNQFRFKDIMLGLEQVLKSNDCKKVATGLKLLSNLSTVAPADVSEFWLPKLEHFHKLQSLRGYHVLSWYNCESCKCINNSSIALRNLLTANSSPKNIYLGNERELCELCKVSTKLALPCGHRYCKKCLTAKLKQAIDSGETILRCVADGVVIPNEWLKNSEVMDKNLALKHNQVVAAAAGMAAVVIKCPQCRKDVCHYPQEQMLLAECKKCDILFCTNCLLPYHGGTECSLTEFAHNSEQDSNSSAKLKPAERVEEQTSASGPPDTPETLGATATSYELDFYRPNDATRKPFDVEDIAGAFTHNLIISSIREIKPWPWELDIRRYSYQDFITPYHSLRAGNWVEDEILEKAMKNILSAVSLKNEFCVLESYVSNWSNYCSYEDGEFLRIIQEKELMNKQVVFTLINTDLKGHGGHWILGVIHVPKNVIILLDSSLVLSPTFYQKFFFSQLHIMHLASILEGSKLDFSKWKLIVSLDSTQQQNAYDCGPLVVANCYAVTKNLQLNRTPESSALRSWIFENVSKFDQNVQIWQEPGTAPEPKPKVDIDTFAPMGLDIEYRFLNRKNIFECSYGSPPFAGEKWFESSRSVEEHVIGSMI